MSVYVLLAFESDEQAHDMIKSMIDVGGIMTDTSVYYPEVKAVFKKPTKFCECGVGGGKMGFSFVRGRKYGWWVHSGCGKPTKAWADGEHWYASLGTNLLPVEIAGEYRPQGWEESAMEWRDLVPIDLDHPNRKRWPHADPPVPSVLQSAEAGSDEGGAA
jgi:hypothetical protein